MMAKSLIQTATGTALIVAVGEHSLAGSIDAKT